MFNIKQSEIFGEKSQEHTYTNSLSCNFGFLILFVLTAKQ